LHPDLESLLALQEKDKAAAAIEKSIAALEPEARALDSELDTCNRALDEAHKQAAGAEARKADLENRIAGYKQLQERRRQQLDFVRGAKEASNLMAEIDMARGVLVKEEADYLRSGDAIVEAEKRVKDAEKAHAAIVAQQAEARAALEARRAELREQLAAASAERAEAAKQVKGQLLQRYERIRRGRTPVAVYALVRGTCSHCNTAVPMARRVLIVQGTVIENCEGCGVLLYAAEG
jgi:predicted  nucleic acid-binding Zn-ribbon protein